MAETQLFQLPLTIELQSPVLIARTVGDENMVGSEDYIPGSVLLGAFARMFLRHIKKNKIKETDSEFTDFANLFLQTRVCFLNGYPAAGKDKTERALPIPFSIQFGKEKGALAEEKFFKCVKKTDKDCEGWELVTFEKLMQQSDEKNATPISKYKSGYCLFTQTPNKFEFHRINVAKQYQFHHERTNQRVGRSADAEIYNYESILPYQTFKSLILGPKDSLELLNRLLQENEHTMRLGRSKHTQYGNAVITTGVIDKYQDEAESLRKFDFLKSNQFILTCMSDVVLHEDVQKINLETIIGMLHNALIQENVQIECKNAFFKIDMVEKYNAAWKARTPAQPCLLKGSCFVFELTGKNTLELKQVFQKLQRDGLGIRRNEGYGRVLINWQGHPLAKNFIDEHPGNTNVATKIPPPPKVAPETTLPLFQLLIQNWLVELVQANAAQKAIDTSDIKIKSNQINKLKSIALNAKTFEIFHDRIKNLNKNSKERLQEIHFGNERFLDFLKKNPLQDFHFAKDKLSQPGIKEFLIYADFHNFRNNPQLQRALFVAYYDTLFTLLDKSLKKNANHKGSEQNG